MATTKSQTVTTFAGVNVELDSVLNPIRAKLTGIATDTKKIVASNIKYLLQTGKRLQAVKDHQKEIAKMYKGGYLIELQTGEKANLAAVKSKKGEFLGYWDYLAKTGLIPFGQSQCMKLIRIAKQAEHFESIPDEEIAAYNIGDANNADKVASVFSKGGTFDDYVSTIGESEEKEAKERREQFHIRNESAKLTVSYFLSHYKSEEQARVALMNELLTKLGWVKVSPTNKAAIIESMKALEKVEERA